jgi:hypothetical protein
MNEFIIYININVIFQLGNREMKLKYVIKREGL